MSKTRKGSIIRQAAALFAVGVLTAGLITFISQGVFSENGIRSQTEDLAANITREVTMAAQEYPARRWLLHYWHVNADRMDIEYDAPFEPGSRTAEKCRILYARHPGADLRYLTEEEVIAMPEDDQRLYAEIVYSWIISRLDEIKRAYGVDYLFCVVTDDAFETQFFLFSAADEGSVRGTNYGEVYPLGLTVTVSADQSDAMRSAYRHVSHLTKAGNYVDYYAFLGESEGQILLVGMTYDLTVLRDRITKDTVRSTARTVVHQLVLSLLCLTLIYLFILKPLRKVQRNIRRYAETKDSEAVVGALAGVRPSNEIGRLSEDVAGLAVKMDDYVKHIETITAEKERIGTELALASGIQAGILPNTFPAFPDRTDFDIYAAMDPAKEVGGDFYDFFFVDETHLAVVMADVSGKGIPAALFMMSSWMLVRNSAKEGLSPAEVLHTVNEQICANNREQMFFTVWLGILDTATGKVVAANAGHEYPALTGEDGRFTLMHDKHGFVVGGMEGMRYKDYEFTLALGGRLFLYTDGLPEATDADEVAFGTDRMLDALNAEPGASPKQILLNVRQAVDGFVRDAEQFDDLTMLCLEYRGPGAPGTEKREETAP